MIRFGVPVVEAIVAHARFAAPDEACGLLAVDPNGRIAMVYPLTNIERSAHRYTVDPAEHYGALRHAERNGWAIGGVFHSHPTTPAYPSPRDVAGALDPEWLYVIVALADPSAPSLRAYRIRDGVVMELDVEVVEASPAEGRQGAARR